MPKGEERVGRGCARNPSLWVGVEGGGWRPFLIREGLKRILQTWATQMPRQKKVPIELKKNLKIDILSYPKQVYKNRVRKTCNFFACH